MIEKAKVEQVLGKIRVGLMADGVILTLLILKII